MTARSAGVKRPATTATRGKRSAGTAAKRQTTPMSKASSAVLAPMDHQGRLARLRKTFDTLALDAMFVTNLTDVRWLVGFTGSAGEVLVTRDAVLLLTDGRYGLQAAAQVDAAGVDARIEADHDEHAERLTAALDGCDHVALQADHLTWARKRRLAAGVFTDFELHPTEGVLLRLRARKEAAEVARIQAAAAIADAALGAVSERIAAGTSEVALALALDTTMREMGASGPSFETIVASGPNGARPHHRPGQRVLEDGDLVVIDFGATVDGYRSDMTRTFAIGKVSRTARRMLDTVTEAQAAGVAAVRAGVPASSIDDACREVIDAAGWEDAFLHSTGHGVGLDIHEEPRVTATNSDKLRAGEVLTVEPGVYLAKHGGVRVEDTLLVTTKGSRPLTAYPKET